MAIKKSKKVTTKEVKKPTKPATKRLDQAEMRKIEELSSAVNYATSQRNLHDQYVANILLKKEKLLTDIKLLDHEVTRAREIQKREEEKIKVSLEKLQKIGNELKLKYGLKASGQIKYDNMTGELIDK